MQVSSAPTLGPDPASISTRSSQPGQIPQNSPEEVGTQFEGLFVSMLLKELRQSLEEGLFSGDESDTYGTLFDLYLGEHLARSGAFGIRDAIQSQYLANQPGVL